ncbi:N-acetylmuramoyl-L-alanine amidase [Streptomyces sp. NPDC056749]|uniref:peptidoglycan recognition protein family protein n=1 Tax=Streptomyces sp. NPDC056749 TaxID=3345936 RepID=UPI00369AC5A2
MATPLSADRLLSALRAEGVTVVEYKDWRTHRRPSSTGTFGPLNGVMIHHTVSSGTDTSVALCYNGHAALPGPLCHGVIDKAGTVHLVSAGRANHAGKGDGGVLSRVQDESYSRDSLLTPSSANTDGNTRFYGFECVNLGDGRDPWPAAQRDAIVRAAAAICRAYGWNARSVIGHREWQPGKVDPRTGTGTGGVDVAPPVLRGLVDERLAHPASWNPGSSTAPSEEDPMAGMTPRDIYNAVWRQDIMTPPTGAETKDNPTWHPESVLRDAANQARGLRATVAAQGVAITQLAAAIAAQDQAVDVDALIARITTAIESITVRLDTGGE